RRHRARARPLPIPLARAGVATVAALSALAAMGASPAVGASPAGAATPMAAKATACDLPALAHHSGTVDIDFWESMVQANGTTLTTLTDKFNASQTKVHVNLVQQKSYTTTWTKYQAGLSNGQLPDVVQLTRIDLQGMVDSRSVLPAQACMKAAHYKTSDFIPRVLAAYKVNGVEVGMPFALSTPVLIYNKLAFTAAGISAPPATLHQMVADAAVLKAHGSGMGLKLDPWHLETWLATANQLFVNNGNGQHGRATKAAFDTATGRKIWAELAPMVRSGDATTNLAQGTGQYDNLLGIGAGKYAMSITTSAVLGTVTALLASGNYPNVQLGVAPFPVYSTKKKGGIEPGGSALYISNRVPTLDQAAAWDYIAFLDSTASQATWAAGTGYIPIRKSATKTPTVQGLWQSNPGYKVSYAQMVDGGSSAATAGAVIGPYPQVRQAELAGEEAMFQQGVSPAKAISSTAAKVGQILAQYNRRVGGS
ncbi:MAG: ABC transporter substrate-binding protein, partial [Acidimicrobiales bacterium]